MVVCVITDTQGCLYTSQQSREQREGAGRRAGCKPQSLLPRPDHVPQAATPPKGSTISLTACDQLEIKCPNTRAMGGDFTSKPFHLVMKYILIVLGRAVPEAGMQKMLAVSESLDDGIKRDFDFSIFTFVPRLPPQQASITVFLSFTVLTGN